MFCQFYNITRNGIKNRHLRYSFKPIFFWPNFSRITIYLFFKKLAFLRTLNLLNCADNSTNTKCNPKTLKFIYFFCQVFFCDCFFCGCLCHGCLCCVVIIIIVVPTQNFVNTVFSQKSPSLDTIFGRFSLTRSLHYFPFQNKWGRAALPIQKWIPKE